MKILLLEDNETIVKGLSYTLNKEGFDLDVAYKIKEIEDKVYDLAILDVNLPDGNGFDVFHKFKEKNIPVIFLTARDSEDDVCKGLELGADDYIIKPFRPKELVSRINRILKRNQKNEIIYENLKIDLESNRVFYNDEEIVFTALEYKILILLFSNLNRLVTRDEILDKIWDESGNFVNDNTLTVYIKRVRTKLPIDIIKTIKGIGYRIDSK